MSLHYPSYITVNLQVEGVHLWKDAPDDIDILRNLHRHVFHIKVWKRVSHQDRNIEIIKFKHSILNYLREKYGVSELAYEMNQQLSINWLNFGSMSCEMIAHELTFRFNLMRCEVEEDGENGGGCESFVHQLKYNPIVFVIGRSCSGKDSFVKGHLPNYDHIGVSHFVKTFTKSASTEALNNTADLSPQIIKALKYEMQSRRFSRRVEDRNNICIEGIRQIEILKELIEECKLENTAFSIVHITSSLEDRIKRFNQRNRATDGGLSYEQLDELNSKLGMNEIELYLLQADGVELYTLNQQIITIVN